MAKTNIGRVSVVPKGEYSSTEDYKRLDVVSSDGSMYMSKKDNNIGNPLNDENWWFKAVSKGEVGPQGEKPINGVDYNTDEEKEEFKNDVVSKATEEVEKNVADIENEAIENYNKNATQKTTEYNTNANTQVESFNTNATSKTNDFNSNASTKTEEFNAVVDEEKEQFAGQTDAINHHIAVVSDELERVKNDVLETGTDTDTFIHLEDSAMAEYQELSVDGVCEQETTSGKNLVNIENNSISEALTNVAINNHEIKFTTIANSQYEQTIFFKNILLKANKTYSIMRIKSSEVPSTMGQLELYKGSDWIKVLLNGMVNSGTFTVSEDDIYAVRIKLSNANQPSYTGTISNIMISEEGGEYEPYTGGQPSPSPDYPQEIKTIENSINVISSTRNLLVLEDVENKVLSGTLKYTIKDGLVSCNGTPSGPWDFKNIKTLDDIFIDGETYTLWCNQMNYDRENDTPTLFFSLFAKRKDTGELMEIQKGIGFGNLRYIQTKVDYSKYSTYMLMLRASANYTDNYSNSGLGVMITKGNEIPTKFEQCLQSQITANLPQGEFIGKINDTYKDTLKVEYNEDDGQYHLVLNKKINKIVLDGINNKFTYMDQSSHPNCLMIPKNSRPRGIRNTDSVISTHFKITSGVPNTPAIGWDVSTQMWINNDGFTTLETGNDWLSSNNVEVYYVLSEPYTVDLGIVDMPITYDEITNLFTDSDLMPTINAKYYRNFTKTIADLQVNNKSLLEELTELENKVTTLESNNADLESRVLALENKEISTTSLESEVK